MCVGVESVLYQTHLGNAYGQGACKLQSEMKKMHKISIGKCGTPWYTLFFW